MIRNDIIVGNEYEKRRGNKVEFHLLYYIFLGCYVNGLQT